MVITSGKIYPEEEMQMYDTLNQCSVLLNMLLLRVIEVGGKKINSALITQSYSEVIVSFQSFQLSEFSILQHKDKFNY